MKGEGIVFQRLIPEVAHQPFLATGEIGGHQVRLLEVATDLVGRALGPPPLRLPFSNCLPRGLSLRFSPGFLSLSGGLPVGAEPLGIVIFPFTVRMNWRWSAG